MVALPAPASALVTCAFSSSSSVITVTIGQTGDDPRLSVKPTTGQVVVSGAGVPNTNLACLSGLPQANKAARIDVVQAFPSQDARVIIDTSTPFLSTLGGSEGSGIPELEINVDLGTGRDSVDVMMGDGNDTARLGTLAGGSTGINLNAGSEPTDPDGDDVMLTGVETVDVVAGLGTDSNVIDARGGPEFTGPYAGEELLLTGSGGGDQLSAGATGSALSGREGDDTLRGGPGNDTLRGGPGRDTLTYDAASGGVAINLSTDTAQNTGGAGTDTLDHGDNSPGDTSPDFEDLIGSAFDDTLTGTNTANDIVGGAGVDTIAALDGNDNVGVDDGISGERVDCGGGIDTATADALGSTPLDLLTACETPTFVDRTPPPPPPAPGLSTTPAATTGTVDMLTDRTPPTLRSLRLSPTRFRAARTGSGLRAAAATGTRATFALSERATVIFRVERARVGRRVRGRCRASTTANRRARRCTRYVLLAGRSSRPGRTGANAVRFSGRLPARRLSPGRYRLVLTATDPSGNRGAARRIGFTIIR